MSGGGGGGGGGKGYQIRFGILKQCDCYKLKKTCSSKFRARSTQISVQCIKYIQHANEPTTPYQVFQFITDTLLRSAKSNLIPEKSKNV